MDPINDIFSDDHFSVANLRTVSSNVTYVPQYLGQQGIFQPKPLTGTDKVLVYEQNGVLRLIPTTERGGPDIMAQRDTHLLTALQAKRISKKDSVQAHELLGIANDQIPRGVRLRTAGELVTDRLTKLKSEKSFTMEKHRFGALQGLLYDADGTTLLYDYFAEFGLAVPAIININLSTWTEAETAQQLTDLIYRPMMRSLKDRKTPNTRIGCLVGDGAWGKLMKNPAFRKIWELEMHARAIARAANPLVQPNAWTEVDFGGCLFINYMGTDDGTTIAMGADEMRFFPIGATDVFDVYLAPGETFLDASQPGRDEYVYIQVDPRNAMPSFVDIVVRVYPLFACIYPKALMRGLAV
jgi:hypothetical protein